MQKVINFDQTVSRAMPTLPIGCDLHQFSQSIFAFLSLLVGLLLLLSGSLFELFGIVDSDVKSMPLCHLSTQQSAYNSFFTRNKLQHAYLIKF